MAIRTPLTSRPIDLLYFIFFVVHIPATLLIDFQAVWPKHLIPESLQLLPPWYRIPTPVFVIGAYGLWKDSRGIYGLLVLYGASTCTTTYACIAAILEAPTTHAPFFVIPLFLAVDMAVRLQKLAAVGIRALESSKRH
ncbi:hypothetical protein EDB92DRAFT_1901417, partial [Lactarius akahatsu]